MLSAVSYRNSGDLRISATGGLKVGPLASGCLGAVVWVAVVARIFVNIKIVVRFTIRSPSVAPAERDFNGGAWMGCCVTRRQIRGQRKVVTRLGRIIAFRADIDFNNWRGVDHEKRASGVGHDRRALRDGAGSRGRCKTHHGQKATRRAKQECGE